MTETLHSAIDKWSNIALTEDWLAKWRIGAILPSEMVFFLARCEEKGISAVVESGRQDGISTEILARFARETGAQVVSLDIEEFPERAAECRGRLLAIDPVLDLRVGNTFHVLGEIIKELRGQRCAILMDGPKGIWAISALCAAAAYDNAQILSLHNLAAGQPAQAFFQSFTRNPVFHEDIGEDLGTAWQKLRSEERDYGQREKLTSFADHSSLGVMDLDPETRRRAKSAWAIRLAAFQPAIIRWLWKTRNYRLMDHLLYVSLQLGRFSRTKE